MGFAQGDLMSANPPIGGGTNRYGTGGGLMSNQVGGGFQGAGFENQFPGFYRPESGSMEGLNVPALQFVSQMAQQPGGAPFGFQLQNAPGAPEGGGFSDTMQGMYAFGMPLRTPQFYAPAPEQAPTPGTGSTTGGTGAETLYGMPRSYWEDLANSGK